MILCSADEVDENEKDQTPCYTDSESYSSDSEKSVCKFIELLKTHKVKKIF